MFQPNCLPFPVKMGEFHIFATALAGKGITSPLMHASDLKGVFLEIYPLAEGITWKIFHEKGYRGGDLIIFGEKYLDKVQKFFLPDVKEEDLEWYFSFPGITKTRELERPAVYLAIGSKEYLSEGRLKTPFEIAGDNTQQHYGNVFKPKPPRPLGRNRDDCDDCEHND